CVLDYRDEKGARKLKWISTGLEEKGNKRKATEMLNKIIMEYEQKEPQTKTIEGTSQRDILFTDYMKNWLERKKGKVEKTTWDGYYMIIYKHFIPYFKPQKLQLNAIKPKHVIDYYEFKFRLGRADNKAGLSLGSVKKHSVLLKGILNQAYVEELIDRNPAFKIPLPKRESTETKAKFLTAKEANKILKIFSGNKLLPIVYLTLYYGLRRGEVIGLKWSAIDFKNNKLKINHIITQSLSGVEAKDKTKTAAGKREYTLLPEIKEILLKVKEEQKNYKKILKKGFNNSDYVFTWPDGKPYKPDYITKEFPKVLAKNNFPKMRFHDLRHSCASILYDKKWELKDIQTWLGHANIQTTANIYTHVSKNRKEILAKDLEHTFSI
ncbi:MAG: site-specific integrase, partial [Clostridia bacterium]|nr:site-specific integrase [Clostridia bacterium]